MHRDLKLENIIVEEIDGKELIYLVDFGFACFKEENFKYFPQCGTPGYIAPEILKGKQYGTNVDIFSVGIIFYILLTLKNPFFDGKKDNILKNNSQCKIDFDLDNNVSNQSMDLLKKMLKKDPSKRLTAKECLNHPCFHTNTIMNFIKNAMPSLESVQRIKMLKN